MEFSTSGSVAQYSYESQWKARPRKHTQSRWNFVDILSGMEKHAFEVLRPPSWIFTLPVWSHSTLMSPNGELDSENIGIAVGISLISCLEVEIYAFEVWRPPSWIFPLPEWSPSLPIGSSGLLDPHHTSLVAVAVGISYLSSPGAKLLAFTVLWPPSWIIHFRFGCTVSALVPLECCTPKTWV